MPFIIFIKINTWLQMICHSLCMWPWDDLMAPPTTTAVQWPWSSKNNILLSRVQGGYIILLNNPIKILLFLVILKSNLLISFNFKIHILSLTCNSLLKYPVKVQTETLSMYWANTRDIPNHIDVKKNHRRSIRIVHSQMTGRKTTIYWK